MNEDIGLPDEIVEIDEERWILLVFDRRWPKYVVTWSIRQRSGDSDFPIARGEFEALPSKERSGADQIWSGLRQQALDAAMAAQATAAPEQAKSRGFLSRLFGKE
jgi:hypothetical protein